MPRLVALRRAREWVFTYFLDVDENGEYLEDWVTADAAMQGQLESCGVLVYAIWNHEVCPDGDDAGRLHLQGTFKLSRSWDRCTVDNRCLPKSMFFKICGTSPTVSL